MKISKLYLSAVFITLLLIPLQNDAAVAQTTDGETPAVEQICDELKEGATPGLYGLCIAYCEAQDADLTDNMTIAEVEESIRPNERILINYNRKRTESDPVMPCTALPEASQCTALLSDEELSEIQISLDAVTDDPNSAAYIMSFNKQDEAGQPILFYRFIMGHDLWLVIETSEQEGSYTGKLDMLLNGGWYQRLLESPEYTASDHAATQACLKDVIMPMFESLGIPIQ